MLVFEFKCFFGGGTLGVLCQELQICCDRKEASTLYLHSRQQITVPFHAVDSLPNLGIKTTEFHVTPQIDDVLPSLVRSATDCGVTVHIQWCNKLECMATGTIP